MLTRHHNLAITGDQRLVFVTLLSRAADDTSLAAEPEFRAAMWGPVRRRDATTPARTTAVSPCESRSLV